MQHQPKVQILLSTYNGEKWLPDLFHSLLIQSWKNWELLIRDDGSTDNTRTLIEAMVWEHPGKVEFFRDDNERLGSTQSFSRLAKLATANYLLFCDQDDIWFMDKIIVSMKRVLQAEESKGRHQPILVHSDMVVVEHNLDVHAVSFWKYRQFRVNQPKDKYLVQNVVSGCSVLVNRAVVDLAFPVPSGVRNYDHWMALVVAWFGHVEVIKRPLLYYRQHEANQIGAKVPLVRSVSKSVKDWSFQAECFLFRYETLLSDEEHYHLSALATLPMQKSWQKRKTLVQEHIYKDGFMPNVAMLLLV